MNDKDKQVHEEEYQFPGDEYAEKNTSNNVHDQDYAETVPAEEVQPSNPRAFAGRRPFWRNKRMIGVVVLIILFIIGFHFYRSFSHRTKVLEKLPATRTTPPAQPQYTAPNPQELSQINQLQQTAAADETNIQQLQNQVQDLKSTLNNDNNSTQQLNQTVQALIGQMRHVTEMMGQKNQNTSHQHKTKLLTSPPVVYHLKAVVPGRAWLMGSNGVSNTVRVGQSLKNYGVIEAIDSNRGLILTSSGKVIGYGPNDS